METNTTTLRVLDTLSRRIGESESIRSLADQVEEHHGTGHYPNVHEQLDRLQEEGIVRFEKAGRSKIPHLRFDRVGFPDTMATLELWRKDKLLKDRPAAAQALIHLEANLANDEHVLSISLAEPHRNLKLRRLEPLVLLRSRRRGEVRSDEREVELELTEQLANLEEDTSLRIDPWILPAQRYGEWLRAPEASPAPRILRSEICLWHPQAFWRSIAESLPHGEGLAPETPARVASLDDAGLAWNLTRWGYEERGRELDDGGPALCPETVTIGALAKEIPRWIGAAGVVLTKADIQPALLAYLAKAEEQGDQLAGILEILLEREPTQALQHTLDLLNALGIESTTIEQDMVLDAVELYGG